MIFGYDPKLDVVFIAKILAGSPFGNIDSPSD